jgi:HEAT repeat protein
MSEMTEAVSSLLVASALLCIVLTGFTVLRKLGRDRNEALFLARRARFSGLLLGGTPDALGNELRKVKRVRSAQTDLLIALNVAWPKLDSSRREILHRSVVAARFDGWLLRRLRSHDAVVRATAVLLVSRLHLPDASELIAPLVNDGDGDVRLVTVRALADLADRRAAQVLIAALGAGVIEPERVIERLGNAWSVDTILDILGRGGNGSHQMIASDPALQGRPIRAWLARALGLAGDPSAEPVLRRLLRTGDVEERVSAARALGTTGSAGAVPDLEVALLDAEWQVRVQAAKALGLLGMDTVVPGLAARLSDSAWWVRAAAAEALVDLGAPGLEALRAALAHPDRYASDRAREALALHDLTAGNQ